MVKQKCFDGFLNEIHKKIMPPNVGEFMGEQCLQLLKRQLESGRWNHNDGFDPTQNQGRDPIRRHAQSNRAPQTKPRSDADGGFVTFRRHRNHGSTPPKVGEEQAARIFQRQ